MPRQFQMTSVGGMTLEARTRMLGLFPSKVRPSRPDAAVADKPESSLRKFLSNDWIPRTDTFLLEPNARPCSPFNLSVRSRTAPNPPARYWQAVSGIPRSVRDAVFRSDRASLNHIGRHGNFRSYGVKVRGCALELELREYGSAAIQLKAGMSDVAAFAGATN